MNGVIPLPDGRLPCYLRFLKVFVFGTSPTATVRTGNGAVMGFFFKFYPCRIVAKGSQNQQLRDYERRDFREVCRAPHLALRCDILSKVTTFLRH